MLNKCFKFNLVTQRCKMKMMMRFKLRRNFMHLVYFRGLLIQGYIPVNKIHTVGPNYLMDLFAKYQVVLQVHVQYVIVDYDIWGASANSFKVVGNGSVKNTHTFVIETQVIAIL